ncbi:hypothetical protein ABC795_01370 [Blastococcus sp. HT6-30]|uniref:hypothetical protein n=1 Tax=Blastococcus sp. HT6-30 TaxID=3144843 RepID=UPI00321B72DC
MNAVAPSASIAPVDPGNSTPDEDAVADYSRYVAAAMLLGMIDTFAAALIPMPLTHAVRSNPPGSEARRRGLAFACS